MSYSNLNLDQARIPNLLATALPGGTVGPLVPKGKYHECTLEREGKQGLIHFYFNKDGTTTIQTKVGKNPDISVLVAEHVKKSALIDERANFSLALKSLTTENVGLLMDYLREEASASITTTALTKQPKHTMYRAQGKQGDTLVFKHFANGTLQVQGKPLHLYRETIAFLSEYLSLEDVVKSQSDVYRVAIDARMVRDELEAFLPTAHAFLGQTLTKILSASVTLRKIDVTLDDYSAFVFPALKGLEGYIKKLFATKGIAIQRGEGFKDYFERNATRSSFILTQDARGQIGCARTCDAIQKCYTIFNIHRHRLFHADAISDASRIISTREEAIALIDMVLAEIESSFGPLAVK
jgi:hypothetical protein